MSYRYIGSKQRLKEEICKFIGRPSSSSSFFVDAFCGTGVIAETAFNLGWNVRINDNLKSAVILSVSRLISVDQAKFRKFGGYGGVISKLNSSKPVNGFIWRTYSPASIEYCGIERRYFNKENAARIDGMRKLIANWRADGDIDENEERLLLGDLLAALNRVANIAGTFGCFLSKWTSQSKDKIAVRCRDLKLTSSPVEVFVGDVFAVPNASQDLVYLDPPYTKRQYASYYHILETVAIGDEPVVEGVAGLRPWKGLASDFCYKTRALGALCNLINILSASKILLSYSSEGHINIRDIKTELSKIGSSAMYPLRSIGRYRPNKVASINASDVNEFLVVVEKQMSDFSNNQSLGIVKDLQLESYA